MKLDKETVIKQRFWFLLPLVFVLIFMALGSVWSIANEAQTIADKVRKKYQELERLPVNVTDKLLQQLRQEREKAVELRWRLWTDMFNLQNDVTLEDGQPIIRRYLIRWPDHEAFQKFAVTKDFGEPFSRDEFPHDLFRTHFPRLYDSLLDILPLYDEKTGRGAVRIAPVGGRAAVGFGGDVGAGRAGFAPGGAAAANATTREMMLSLLEPISFREGTLTNDEIWYALEEVAVKRLILEALRRVLDGFAVLKPEFVPLGEPEYGSTDASEPDKKPGPSKPGFAKPGPSKAEKAGGFGIPSAQGKPSGAAATPVATKPAADATKPSEGSWAPQDKSKPNPDKTTAPAAGAAADKPMPGASPTEPHKATPSDAKPTPDKTAPPRQLILRRRFYNRVWHFEPLGELKEADANKPLPVLGDEEGWLLDVRITAELDENRQPRQYYLEITSQNYSPRFDIPAMPLRVWLETSRGLRFSVDVSDAGSVPKAPSDGAKSEQKGAARTNMVPRVSQPSQRILESIPLRLPPVQPVEGKDAGPEELDQIVGVQRVPPKGAVDYQRLANPHWIMDVQVQRDANGVGFEVAGQIYNRSGRRQTPPAFEVVLSDGTNPLPPKEIRPLTKPLDAYQVEKFKENLGILANVPKQITSIKQVLDWQTTPIKRLDALHIGEGAIAQADRLWNAQLYMYPFHIKAQNRQNILDFSDALQAQMRGGGMAAGGAPGVPGKPGGLPAAGQGSGPAGFDAGPGAGQQHAGGEVSRNGIPLRRYYPDNPADTRALPDRVPEVRRLPIAVVLLVDYPVLPDILVALANSPLRIQVTQAVFTRHPPLGPPPAPQTSNPVAAPGGAIANVATTPSGQESASDTAEMNLIELQVYGLASIYENPYMSSEWISPQGGSAAGAGGPARLGPPGGGGKPPVFRAPDGDSRDRRPGYGPGRRGSGRGRR
ncbi:hypothetical protein HRbin36_02008 [bacterium HR36]|nr:hypothetical protein HRbin36_02008 [bacterium HR36]